MSIKSLVVVAVLFVCMATASATNNSPVCNAGRTKLLNAFSPTSAFTNYILNYLQKCITSGLLSNNNNTDIECSPSNETSLSTFETACENTTVTLDNTFNNQTVSGKICTYTVSVQVANQWSKILNKTFTFVVCEATACSDNSTDLTTEESNCQAYNIPEMGSLNSIFKPRIVNSCTLKCGGFPVWAIILIVVVVVVICILIIVVVVFMMRRKSSYQNI